MFRDSRGVVHTVCSARPLDDLPAGAVDALTAELLTAAVAPVDLGSQLERCDAAVELLERWQDAFFAALPEQVDAVEEAQVAAAAGLSLAELEAELAHEYADEGEGLDGLGGLAGLEGLDLDTSAELAVDALLENDRDPELDALVELMQADDDPTADPRRLLSEAFVAVLERELLLLPMRTRLEALVAAVDLVGEWTALLSDHEKLLGHLVLGHGDLPTSTGPAHEGLVERHARLHDGRGPGHGEEPAPTT